MKVLTYEVDKLLQNFAEDITFFMLKNKVINIEDRDIYIYGFEIILSTLIVTGTLLTLGIILNKILLTLVFMFIFIILRIYTGGYHSEKFKSCFVISIAIYLSELLLNDLVADNLKLKVGIILILIASSIIYRLSPVEHKNNPLSFEDKKKYKKISRVITLLILVLTLIGFYINDVLINFCFISSLTVTAVSILLVIPFLKRGVLKND